MKEKEKTDKENAYISMYKKNRASREIQHLC